MRKGVLIMGDITLQTRRRSFQSQYESSRNNVRSSRRRMGVVVRVIRVNDRSSKVLEEVSGVQPMVDEDRPSGGGSITRIVGEAACAVDECARLPWVVGCGTGDEDVRALGDEELGGVDEVCLVCEDGFGHTATKRKSVRLTQARFEFKIRTRRPSCMLWRSLHLRQGNLCARCRC